MKRYLFGIVLLFALVSQAFSQNPTLADTNRLTRIINGRLGIDTNGAVVGQVPRFSGLGVLWSTPASSGGDIFSMSNNLYTAGSTNRFPGFTYFGTNTAYGIATVAIRATQAGRGLYISTGNGLPTGAAAMAIGGDPTMVLSSGTNLHLLFTNGNAIIQGPAGGNLNITNGPGGTITWNGVALGAGGGGNMSSNLSYSTTGTNTHFGPETFDDRITGNSSNFFAGTNYVFRIQVGTNAPMPFLASSDRLHVYGDTANNGPTGHTEAWYRNGTPTFMWECTTANSSSMIFSKSAGAIRYHAAHTNNTEEWYVPTIIPTNAANAGFNTNWPSTTISTLSGKVNTNGPHRSFIGATFNIQCNSIGDEGIVSLIQITSGVTNMVGRVKHTSNNATYDGQLIGGIYGVLNPNAIYIFSTNTSSVTPVIEVRDFNLNSL